MQGWEALPHRNMKMLFPMRQEWRLGTKHPYTEAGRFSREVRERSRLPFLVKNQVWLPSRWWQPGEDVGVLGEDGVRVILCPSRGHTRLLGSIEGYVLWRVCGFGGSVPTCWPRWLFTSTGCRLLATCTFSRAVVLINVFSKLGPLLGNLLKSVVYFLVKFKDLNSHWQSVMMIIKALPLSKRCFVDNGAVNTAPGNEFIFMSPHLDLYHTC